MKNTDIFIKSFYCFGPSDSNKNKIKTITKYKVPINTDLDGDIDDNAVALLCFPDGIMCLDNLDDKFHNPDLVNKKYSEFHSFLITKENGLRIYGSTLIIFDKFLNDNIKVYNYFSKALCLLTKYPFIVCTEKILNYIWKNSCSIEMIQLICNVKLSPFGKCIHLILPKVLPLVNEDKKQINISFKKSKSQNNFEDNMHLTYQNEDIFIFPGTKEFPLYDYSSKYLFTKVLSIENFVVAFTATLLEYQILIISNCFYKLMLVAESLTTFLLPFKWQHVYVPILPSKLGLHYLDAPTPYIMGILNYKENIKNLNNFQISLSSSVKCKIDCDLNSVEFYAENELVDLVNKQNELDENFNKQIDELDDQNKICTFTVPQFLSDLQKEIEEFINKDPLIKNDTRNQSNAIKRITEIAIKHNVINNNNSYIDDMNFNQKIRLIFYDYMKKHLLSNYERYIVIGKKDTVKFDSVSFLSDQPSNMVTFLNKFLKTQIFASFIDESARLLNKIKITQKDDFLKINDTNELIEEYNEDLVDEFVDEYVDEFVGEFNNLKFNESFTKFDDIFKNAIIVNLNYTKKSKNVDCVTKTRLNKNLNTAKTKNLNSPFKLYSPKKTNSYLNIKKINNNYNSLSKNRLNHNEILDSNDDEFNSKINSANENFEISEEREMINSVLNSPLRQTEIFAEQTNWRVVESLLKEVKNKTKKILIEKMGDEEIAPLGINISNNLEENSLIAALCDLIERIWTHAKSSETSHFRCAFWVHVSAYCQILNTSFKNNETKSTYKNLKLTPDNQNIENQNLKKKSLNENNNLDNDTFFGHTNLNLVSPVPTSIFYDYNFINKLTNIKTEIGKSRAFIRLALERKLLSTHLRNLLSNQQLTCAFYKSYAFLRCDDEKEQFLTHLLTLNAVDLMPFTNTFTTSKLKYKLIFYGSTSFNGYFSLSGSLYDFIDQPILNAIKVYTFECKNLGLISNLTLRINDNNKLYLEYCFLVNEITGQTYRFRCNCWFGKNIDDGACEHVFNGQLIPNEQACEILKKCIQSKSSSVGRHWSKAFDIDKKEIIDLDELKDLLGKSVNLINKFYYSNFNINQHNYLLNDKLNHSKTINNNKEGKKFLNNKLIKNLNNKFIELNDQLNNRLGKENSNILHLDSETQSPFKTLKIKHEKDAIKLNRFNRIKLEQNLAKLLFGNHQLIWILNKIFYFAFKNKSKSSFKKQIFVWDYVLRVQCEIKLNLRDYDSKKIFNLNQNQIDTKQNFNDLNNEKNLQSFYINLIDRITNKAIYYGKDGKFNLFLLIALREHMLTKLFNLLSSQLLVSQFYDKNSFLRDNDKILFLNEILKPLEIIDFNLDQSFTKGL